MSTHVHRNQPIIARKIGVELTTPREPALRKAVDEQNWWPRWIPGFDQMELAASAACDDVMLHGSSMTISEPTEIPVVKLGTERHQPRHVRVTGAGFLRHLT